jgi:hypothetical protein
MTLTLQLLNRLPPRFDDFEYYQVVVDKIIENQSANPDIAIESCKSLVEGLSKSILKHTDKSYRDSQRPAEEMLPLFKKAVNALADRGANVEEQFTKAVGNLIHQLGSIRNERGDISHGKSGLSESLCLGSVVFVGFRSAICGMEKATPKLNGELGGGSPPTRGRFLPFPGNISQGQIDQFARRLVAWKMAPVF